MTVLFFDTETTGLADFDAPADAPHQPHLVEMGALLVRDGRELARLEMLVRPDGFTIPEDAVAVHGITTDRAAREGFPLDEVVTAFLAIARSAEMIVSHNLDFDSLVMRAAAIRCGYTTPPLADGVQSYCTMRAAMPVCRLPGKAGHYKRPSLAEAHAHFYGAPHAAAHGALADVLACRRVFEALHGRPVPMHPTEDLVAAMCGLVREFTEMGRSHRAKSDLDPVRDREAVCYFSCAQRISDTLVDLPPLADIAVRFCPRCRVPMEPGIALAHTGAASAADGRVVNVAQCPQCGHSIASAGGKA